MQMQSMALHVYAEIDFVYGLGCLMTVALTLYHAVQFQFSITHACCD